MKYTITVVAASLLTCQGALAAQQTQPADEAERAEGIPATPHQEEATREVDDDLFAQLDADGNGAISREEAQAVATLTDNWSQYDQDGDGALDEEEFGRFEQDTTARTGVAQAGEDRDPAEGIPATRHQEEALEGDLVGHLDKDGDGRVSEEEAQAEAELADNWDQYDANDDGQLDARELDQYRQELRDTEEAE